MTHISWTKMYHIHNYSCHKPSHFQHPLPPPPFSSLKHSSGLYETFSLAQYDDTFPDTNIVWNDGHMIITNNHRHYHHRHDHLPLAQFYKLCLSVAQSIINKNMERHKSCVPHHSGGSVSFNINLHFTFLLTARVGVAGDVNTILYHSLRCWEGCVLETFHQIRDIRIALLFRSNLSHTKIECQRD